MAITPVADDTLSVRAANLALYRVGVSRTIQSFDENTREATTARGLFIHDFRATLRSYPWAFATRYAKLTLHAGSLTAQVNSDWVYAYVKPDDDIFTRRVTTSLKRAYDPSPPVFKEGREGDTLVIYSNLDDQDRLDLTAPSIEIEYTAEWDCPAALVDELFMAALSWRLASSMAPSLAQTRGKAAEAWAMYLHTLDQAKRMDAAGQQAEVPGEAEWIRARE